MVRHLMSRFSVDRLYRGFILSKFFSRGWGEPRNIQRLFEMRAEFASLERRREFLAEPHPIRLTRISVSKGLRYVEGEFLSPLAAYHPGLFEPPVQHARFQMILPAEWGEVAGSEGPSEGPSSAPDPTALRPVVVHMAGTGDHGFLRRRVAMMKPLAREHGIASIAIVNPFYGQRKPKGQFASALKHVTDLFVMGGSLIFEGMSLLNWCKRQGFGPLAVTGISMGGHMASLAACHWPEPVALVPCLSWSTASQCFTEGVLANSVKWTRLEKDYFSRDFQTKLASDVEWSLQSESYGLGQYFARDFEAGSESEDFRWGRHTRQEVAAEGRRRPALPKAEVESFMRGVMDEFTHLANFPRPQDPSLIIALEAQHDAYIPRHGVLSLAQLWPGCEIRYLDSGHVHSCLFHTHHFRAAIREALDRAARKYHGRPLDQPLLQPPSTPSLPTPPPAPR